MEHKDDSADILLETITKELVSIIEEGSENYESNLTREKVADIKSSQDCVDPRPKICSPIRSDREEQHTTKHELSSENIALETKNVSNIDCDIQKMQYNLDESCKMFQAIGERFENINFDCLKNRIKDLHLTEIRANPIMTIVNDLKHSFDESYTENRLNELTKEVASKFRNHPGEFADIPEISEFFRTCTKLEQGLEMLRKQRDDCMNLQNRMTRVAEASYDRVNGIQQKMIKEEGKKSKENI